MLSYRQAKRFARHPGTSRLGGIIKAAHARIAPLSDIRMVVRMSVLLVVAGAVTLFLMTRPYTSSRADAHNSGELSGLVAKTHTEIERVTLRGVDEPAWSEKTDLPPVEPVSVSVEERTPVMPGFDARRVTTQTIRLNEQDSTTAPVFAEEPAPRDEPVAVRAGETQDMTSGPLTTAALGTPASEGATPAPADEQAAPARPDPRTMARLNADFERGLELEKRKDITSARMVYKHAADRGHAGAALAFARTHDIAFHPNAEAFGLVMNADLARKYYAVAVELGSQDAKLRLSELAAPKR
jgi:hypothetical protein